MKNKQPFSRRDFVKTGIISAIAVAGPSTLNSCSQYEGQQNSEEILVFNNKKWKPEDGPAGMLFSQVGYEPGYPVRIVVRLPKKELIPEDTMCRLTPVDEGKEYKTNCNYWGEVWKSHWWVAEFNNIKEEGEWAVEINRGGGNSMFREQGLKIQKNILWDSTIEWSSVDMLERRRHFTKVGAGWQDAGTLWVESPAQSAMIIAMTEMLEKSSNRFDETFKERIYTQLQVGCDYLAMTQEKATELGYSKGSFTHDLHGHETDILPNDAMKAVVALLKTCQSLPEKYAEKKQKYFETAKLAFDWLRTSAKPMGEYGYVKMQRGLSDDVKIPDNEWLTRDLLTMCWASVELLRLGEENAKEYAIEYAQKVIARQIPKEKVQEGFYGHFYEFDSLNHSEPSWIHGIMPTSKGYEFGADIGGVYPNYLMPVIELFKQFPEHEDWIPHSAGWLTGLIRL